MLRRAHRLLGSTNRYTDGSGRALEPNTVPRDLYVQTISNRAYPVQGEDWQPVVAGTPSPHKGNVVISGAGVVGLTVAAQFALRGWHTTVVERSPPLLQARDEPMPSPADPPASSAGPSLAPPPPPPSRPPYRGPLVRPHFGDAPSPYSPFVELQYALVTRRAVDALEAAGVRLSAIRRLGVRVRGVMDHPGAYNSWLTAGLTEHHPFAVNMLAVDLFQLRRLLEEHVTRSLPAANLQVFHSHVVEAVYPLRQQLVVRPWEGSAAAKQCAEAAPPPLGTEAARTAQLVAAARQPRRQSHTSVTLSARQWERRFAGDAVDYDLLVSAEGVNSHLRDLVDVEGFAADVDMGVRWCLLRCDRLSHEHVHRWLHRRRTSAITTAQSYHVQTAHQVPLTLAFPRVEGSNLFSVMVYAPRGELAGLADADLLRHYLPDLVPAELRSFAVDALPHPTVYCEQLHNTVGLPSAVLVGDAAHTCNPFWMQGLAMGLEDGANLLNQVDAYSRHFYDAVRQYSDERGTSGDALRELTDKCLYYERRKHVSPFIRFQNAYQHFMNVVVPRGWNTLYEGSVNHVYSRSIEDMLNSRGYTSYDYAEKQQAKHRFFYHLGRVYTWACACVCGAAAERRRELMMDSTAGGFFFSFDPPSAEGGGLGSAVAGTGQTAAGAAHGVVSWPPATTSTAAFPWVPLDADTLQTWAAAYCGGGGSGASQAGVSRQRGGRTPKPLQLRLHAAPAPALTLCYQTPPEVDTLTSVVAAADAAPSDSAPREHRDVIPGRYYGGLKVWSCAVLLAQYLAEHAVVYRDMLAAAAVVVELGCGQGLPGMAAMCLGARRVAFQDFNAEVLDVCTKPNVAATMLANADARGGSSGGDGDGVATAPAPQAKFIHGDWVELAWEAADGAACDVILGADVTFDKEACDKLACVLQRWLRPRTGVALLASKDYYFGTSGGHLEFTKSAEPHGLRVELLTRVDTADKMPHVVLRVTHAS